MAQLLLICISAKYLAATIPFCFIIVYVLQKVYLRTSRQLRFLDIEAKAPLFSNFLEALGGIATIRAFGLVDKYERQNGTALDLSQRPYYLLYCIQRWLNLVLDLTVAVIAVILVTISVKTKGTTSAGLIGVALFNVVGFSTSLKALISTWTILETSIGAVSRVRSFASKTESENQPSETQMVPKDWPKAGSIEIKDVSVSYG